MHSITDVISILFLACMFLSLMLKNKLSYYKHTQFAHCFTYFFHKFPHTLNSIYDCHSDVFSFCFYQSML
jgi:hypothetical protein